MSWWLCVTPCLECNNVQCGYCLTTDRPIGLFVKQADARPATAINGPAQEPDELLTVISKNCTFGADGFLRLRRTDCESQEA